MPDHTDTAALRRRIKAGLFRELFRRGVITQAQLAQVLRASGDRSSSGEGA